MTSSRSLHLIRELEGTVRSLEDNVKDLQSRDFSAIKLGDVVILKSYGRHTIVQIWVKESSRYEYSLMDSEFKIRFKKYKTIEDLVKDHELRRVV